MTVTLNTLKAAFHSTDEARLASLVDPINKAIVKFDINNTAMFLAQIGWESGGFKSLEENLNYSAQRLVQVWPSHFRGVSLIHYAHNPKAIADRVYALRMGNGDEASGDGWTYRGRGAIQITGKYLYEQAAKYFNMSIDQVVTYFGTPEGAIMSAAWYWYHNNLNAVSYNINLTTRKINGGLNGLAGRKALYNIIHSHLA